MRIDDYRKEKGLSQREFGAQLEPPASQSLVSQWELGTTRVTLDYSLDIQRKTNGLVTPQDCSEMYVEQQLRDKPSERFSE